MTEREIEKKQIGNASEPLSEQNVEVADYVRDMATQLAQMCEGAKLQDISEHLSCVASEAQRIVEACDDKP